MRRLMILFGIILGLLIAAAGAPIVCIAGETPVEARSDTGEETRQQDPAELLMERMPKGHWVQLGQHTLTFYCNCRRCCGRWSGGPTASGTMPAEGRTVACGSLPLGTRILIPGFGEYIVEDRGVRGKHIDIYMASHAACLKNGIKYANIFRWVED